VGHIGDICRKGLLYSTVHRYSNKYFPYRTLSPLLQESMGESVKVSQNRAALFDMTFLMLVYMVQCFGTSGQSLDS
jgi:hypothetical protein